MAWNDDPRHPFAGIAEKLKRAEENIANLKAEIDLFIQSGKYPIIPDPKNEMWQDAVDYHKTKPIPLRFGVLAGEVVHHLRSSLDHVVWHFSDGTKRVEAQNVIEFPIFPKKPGKTKEIERYKGKVQAITDTKVLTLVEEMQPYNAGADFANHPFLIVHNMDRFDKHRELLIVNSSVNITIPPTMDMDEFRRKAELYSQGALRKEELLELSRAVKDCGNPTPSVAFRQFGKRKIYPAINGLAELWMKVNDAVGKFAIYV